MHANTNGPAQPEAIATVNSGNVSSSSGSRRGGGSSSQSTAGQQQQQQQVQQQQSAYSSSGHGQPMENGIDFRHSSGGGPMQQGPVAAHSGQIR